MPPSWQTYCIRLGRIAVAKFQFWFFEYNSCQSKTIGLESLMSYNFDNLSIEKLAKKASMKWQKYPKGTVPLWVADMDYPIADEIKKAIVDYIETNNFGYADYEGLPDLKEAAIERMWERYGWGLNHEHIFPISGIVQGLVLGVLAASSKNEEVIIQTPVYGPFMIAVEKYDRVPVYNQLVRDVDGWQIDFDALKAQISPATRLLMLCNPHNPVGRVYSRYELEKLAEIVLEHRLWVVSDELHSDIIFSGYKHTPFASISPEVAQRTITLFGPTKTFNIAGLKIGFIATENSALMQHIQHIALGIVNKPNVIAQTATIAAYREGQEWLNYSLKYLEANRDFVAEYVFNNLKNVKHFPAEGSYLAWLDLSKYNLENPSDYLLEQAKVAMNDGAWFGPGGEGHVRLNFATSRSIVRDALERIRVALGNAPVT